MRQRLSRQHLVAHRGVVNEDGLDRGCLLQIGGLQPLVGVHVGVMGACAVIQLILYELEARNSHSVERLVVRAASMTQGDRGNTEVPQRFNPLREDGGYSGVFLQIDSTDLATAV